MTTANRLYRVYFRGTVNVAVNLIAARSPRAAAKLASAMVNVPAAYLVAKQVAPTALLLSQEVAL